jgi:ATP-dependent helicase/nuclease subunit B
LNDKKNRLEISTDAATRIQIARDWLRSFPHDSELLLLAHSSEAAIDLQLHVVDQAGSWFGIKRLTLNNLAAKLAQHSLVSANTAPASSLSFTAVVARAIHSLQSEGKLNYFAPVATRPGFPVAVAATLQELRMNEIDSETVRNLRRGGQDLALIADLVEEELDRSRLADRAAIFRLAIDSVDDALNATYVGLPLLLLDVPVRNKLENDLIKKLSAQSPSVLATLPHGDQRTITYLQQSLACDRNLSSTQTEREVSLSLVKQYLFEETAPDPRSLDESVRLQNWPGEPRECVEIVRSIQAEAARGVPFDQMAVLLNCPGEYRSHLEEAFNRAQVPAYFVQGTTAPDPSGRAMLALLSCAAEGLSAKAFAEYLSLGQVPEPENAGDVDGKWVPPEDELIVSSEQEESTDVVAIDEPSGVDTETGNAIEGAVRAPARWEQLLVESAVIGGKDRWIRRLEGLQNELLLRLAETADEDEARINSIKKQLRDLESLQAYALPLIERLDTLPKSASWGEWLAHLRELAVNALRQPEGVLATLADLEPMDRVGPVDLHEVQLVLGPRLHDLGVRPAKRKYSSVFVGPIDAARGLSFQVVFIPGLAERIFPRKIVEDAILTDSQRLQINEGRLLTRRDRLEAERLGLRIAVGTARERVYFSYPRVDVRQSRPRVPSFYALEALRAAEGKLPGLDEIARRAESITKARLGWPAPDRPDAAIDEAEYDLAVLASLVGESSEDVTGRAHYLLTANNHLARALRARTRRWLKRWTPNDGLVDSAEISRESMRAHQFAARSFSATALQNFASCPYRFFLSAILRLELRQEPTAIETIDPLTRGSVFHETQFQVLTNLKSLGLLPLEPSNLTKAHQLIDKALDRLADDYEDLLAPAIPRVWQDGINGIRADLREWARRMTESEDGWIPNRFELSFGLTDRGPRDSDPDSVADPVEIIGDFKLRGSIDLVERHVSGRFRVTDHKTGKARAEKGTVVGGGKYLQPLLYALASQKLLNHRVESGRLYYCTADGGFEERVVMLDDINLQTVTTVLSVIRQSLAEGFLPAAPDEGACDWCDFLAVCGSLEETRIGLKPRDRLVQLKGLRDLP